MAIPQNVQQEYKITKAEITAERLGTAYDVKQMVSEINFFEDLEKTFVTGQIVVFDDLGVFDEIKIKGTEQIEIVIEVPENTALKLTIKFNIVSIVQVQKVGERSEIYHLNLISPHAYRDQLIKISRSYTGKLEDISEAILKNHLDVRTDRNYMGDQVTKQGPVRIITPYITPLEAVEWLMDRATTEIGAPFYAYQTLYDQQLNDGKDVLRFGNLEYMYKKPVWNEDLPLLYSQARGQEVAGLDLAKQATIVKDLQMHNISDTLKLVQEGAVGTMMSSYDLFSSQRYSRHFGVSKLLEKMDTQGMFPGSAKQNVFDEVVTFDIDKENKKIDEFDARYYNQVTSYGTYGFRNSYHDVFDQSEALNKVRHYAVKSLFNKNMIDVVIPGIAFFSQLETGASGVTVGDLVKINFKNTNVESVGDEEFNKDLSGTYLIHKCRNIFRSTTHEVVASVTKVADLDGGTAP